MPKFEVSIDQDECTSCNLCPEIAKQHFMMGDDGVAYVREYSEEDPTSAETNSPQFRGFEGKVAVAESVVAQVIDAAEECPGECIYVEEVGAIAQAS